MTIVITNTPTSQDSLPTILWDNIFASGTLTASSEAADYPKENAVSEATYNSWKPSSLPAQLTIDCGASKYADSFAIVAHDVGTKGLTVSLQSSTDNTNWTNRCIVSPSNDTSILGLFSGVSAQYWRCNFSVKNLLIYTEQFDNAAWTKIASSVTPNSSATTAPDGTFTADILVEDTTTGGHYVAESITWVAGQTYTLSTYIKAQSTRNFRLAFPTAIFGSSSASFDANTGAVLNSFGGTSPVITPLPNGWYRVSITKTAPISGAGSLFFDLLSVTATSYTGNGTSGIYLWGAQLELGSTPSDYFKVEAASTTNQPSIGVAMAGARFNFPAGVVPPYKPVWLSQAYELLTATTLGGQFLGNRVLRQGGQTSINLVAVDRTFGETTILPFREHFNSGKAFVWAAGPSVFSKDVGYVWRTEGSTLAPTFDATGVFMSVGMEVYAYGE